MGEVVDINDALSVPSKEYARLQRESALLRQALEANGIAPPTLDSEADAEARRLNDACGLTYTDCADLNHIAERVHGLAKAKGWYDGAPRPVPELLMLVVSELSEALEEYRRSKAGDDLSEIYYDKRTGKPEGFAVEVGDALIRILDMCEEFEIDIAEVVNVKHAYNMQRERRHGGKRC
jgi:hypothetical protein